LGAVAVACWRFHLYGQVIWTRYYDWPDVHADGLLIGCALAFMRPEHVRTIGKAWPLALAAMAVFVINVRWETPPIYWGSIFAMSLAAAVIVAAAATSAALLSAPLKVRPVRYIGKISYGLYLLALAGAIRSGRAPVVLENNRCLRGGVCPGGSVAPIH
jgi:peptidoglycan/LPS O-acetylase OafA/YrhL